MHSNFIIIRINIVVFVAFSNFHFEWNFFLHSRRKCFVYDSWCVSFMRQLAVAVAVATRAKMNFSLPERVYSSVGIVDVETCQSCECSYLFRSSLLFFSSFNKFDILPQKKRLKRHTNTPKYTCIEAKDCGRIASSLCTGNDRKRYKRTHKKRPKNLTSDRAFATQCTCVWDAIEKKKIRRKHVHSKYYYTISVVTAAVRKKNVNNIKKM